MNILVIIANPFTHDSRVLNEAKSLVKAGFKITVLAWDSYKENALIEKRDGINIVRIRNTELSDLLHYGVIRLPFWYRAAYNKAIELNKEYKFSLVHCHDLTTLPIGIRLKKKIGCPLIYDAHEIYVYMLRETEYPLNWLARYFIWKERKILKYADKIITVSEPLKEYFSSITNKPVTIIMHCKPLQNVVYEHTNNNKFTIIYLGGLYESRSILRIIEIVKELPDVCYIIGGTGLPTYVDKIRCKILNAPNIYFVGQISEAEVLPMTKQADAVVCVVNPKDAYQRIGISNKIFEAMVCGRPILASKDTYIGELVDREKCGFALPYTKNDLKDAIVRLRDHTELREELGKNAMNAAIGKYNWEKESEKLIEIYENILFCSHLSRVSN